MSIILLQCWLYPSLESFFVVCLRSSIAEPAGFESCLIAVLPPGVPTVRPNVAMKSTVFEGFIFVLQGGKLEKTIKSEEAPADNSGPVKIVTAKTLDEIVFSGKNVLIEFYAPW